METEFNVKVLTYTGLYNVKKHRTTFMIYLLFFLIPHGLMYAYYYGVKMNLYIGTIYLSACMNGVVTLIRWYYFNRSQQGIEEILASLNETYASGQNAVARKERELKAKSTRRVRMYNTLIFSYTLCLLTALVGGFLLFKLLLYIVQYNSNAPPPRRILIFGMWWFVDWHHSAVTHVMLFLWESAIVGTNLLVSSAADAFSCSLLLTLLVRADILAEDAPRALAPDLHNPQVLPPAYRAWIRGHQNYVATIRKINEVLGPMILLSHFTTVTSTIAFSYIALKVGDAVMSTLSVLANGGGLLQIFLLSKAGQEVLSKGSKLSKSVLTSTQIHAGILKRGPARSALQVLSTRLSAPLDSISGMGLFTVSLSFFTSILNACVSYFVFIVSFRDPEHAPLYFKQPT